jgi:hypothetical protein
MFRFHSHNIHYCCVGKISETSRFHTDNGQRLIDSVTQSFGSFGVLIGHRRNKNSSPHRTLHMYRKPPTISPGLIYFRKRFLMGLYKGGHIYGWAYTWTIFCVSNKQVRHKQVSHKRHRKFLLAISILLDDLTMKILSFRSQTF